MREAVCELANMVIGNAVTELDTPNGSLYMNIAVRYQQRRREDHNG